MRGEAHPSAKLTENDVRQIRREPRTPLAVLAERYGVSALNICRVRNNITWRGVRP